MAPILFGDDDSYEPGSQISIKELRSKFEILGFSTKKSIMLGRYLVEMNQNLNKSAEIIYNENTMTHVQNVLISLQQLIGHYYLYKQEGSEYEEDPNYVQEEYMQKLVFENFHESREALIEALKCEDYEEEGLLELSQLNEAISTVNEQELEPSILDYMLFFVYVRSDDHESMQYSHLVDLIDQM